MAVFWRRTLEILTLILVAEVCVCEYTRVVKIAQGKLRGRKSLLSGQHQYLGIPYAVSDRFQPPQPSPRWRGVLYATDPLVMCPQKIILPIGTENCTVLNVYTPSNTQPHSRLPVMVFFHGGSFFYGSGSITNLDPSYLVDQGVIVVTVNYRLGILGFLCLGIKGASGNMGMKDQVAALRWVRDNIEPFGGDPSMVTIFGESAGAASVHMHMLSRTTRGLFRAVIMESGSAIAPWAINMDPLASAISDASKLGIGSKDPYVILEAFKNAPLVELLHIAKDSVLNNFYKYCPCIEKEKLENEEAYLTDTPYNLMMAGSFSKVPVMMGMNSAEGIFFAGLHNFKTIHNMDKHFAEFVPRAFNGDNLKQKRAAIQKIRHFYFKNESIMQAGMTNLIDFYSDTLTSHSMPKTTQMINNHSDIPVYNYLFNYVGGRNFAKYFMGINLKGVSHADELFYIFKPSSLPLPIFPKDKLIVRRMTTMWTNFAKIGAPIPKRSSLLPVEWLPSGKNGTFYMNIDSQMFMSRQPYSKRALFWEQIFNSYGIEGMVKAKRKERDF